MGYYIWIAINLFFIILFTVYIWVFSEANTLPLFYGQLFAQAAVILFTINVNVFFMIQIIKRTNKKRIKIIVAKFLRKLMKSHTAIGIIASSLISIHIILMLLYALPLLGFNHLKLIAGYIALLLLIINLFAGYLRYHRSTGFRRKFHLYMALSFTFAFIVHVFIPIS